MCRVESNVADVFEPDPPFQFFPRHDARIIEPWQMHELHIYKNPYDLTPWSQKPDPGLRCVRRASPEEWETIFAVIGVPMPEQYRKPVHLQGQVENDETNAD